MISFYNKSRMSELQSQEEQIKTARNRSGTQRFMCRGCGKTSTPEAKKQGYSEQIRKKAVMMYVEGNNFRRIGRLLGVNTSIGG